MKFTGERFIIGQTLGDIVVEHLQRYQSVSEFVKGKIVLDAACGEGYGSYILSNFADKVFGIDISIEAIEYAREKYNNCNLEYRCASINNIPLQDNSVDVIVSFETIEHVTFDLQKEFLAEIKRVLKPDGILIISSPDKRTYSDIRNFNNIYHVHEMYKDEFKNFLKKYFKNATFFKQGIDNKRLGIIEYDEEFILEEVKLIKPFDINPDEMQYIIAVCSDYNIDKNLTDKFVSVMPFSQESPVRVFVDCGNGFNEEDVVIGSVNDNGTGRNFDLSKFNNIRGLRFDPVEHFGCYCKIKRIESNVQNLTVNPINAFDSSADGNDRFLNCDPQYEFVGDFSGITFLNIEYDIELITKEKVVDFLLKEYQVKLGDLNFAKSVNLELGQEIKSLLAKIDLLIEKNSELENICNAKDNELKMIYSSRGYRLVQKYYSFRDFLLPKNSLRRLFVKNIVKGTLQIKKNKNLLNKHNVSKVCYYLQKGEIKALIRKIDTKLNSIPKNILVDKKYISYCNNMIKDNNVIINDSIVVDIIIPIYNAYDFTKRCIEAVYENTDINFNLFLVNDCSPDNRIREILDDLKIKNKPPKLKELVIIDNNENLGFIASVNKAMLLSKNHVVLLNTDAEVPENWLSRLVNPLLLDSKIASITPYSNSATICSFPEFCKDNDLSIGMQLNEIDSIFRLYGGTETVDIPTGVGFCMLMNRECIEKYGMFDSIYGKGYGEENDWCMRTFEEGYHNVMITNLFVYHKHGVSFLEHKDKLKQDRINENLSILESRYPQYNELVQNFIKSDILKINREFLKSIFEVKQNPSLDGVLFINHSMGGGTKVYQNNLIDGLIDKRSYTFELQADLSTIILKDCKRKKEFLFDINLIDENMFVKLLEAFEIKLIYINQLITYPLLKMMNLIRNSNVNYIYFIHDYYAVCPSFNLVNNNNKYCYMESNNDICNKCLEKLNMPSKVDIKLWRNLFNDFLKGAFSVIAPSNSAKEIVNNYYPEVKVIVKEHDTSKTLFNSFRAEFLNDEYLKIGIIGAISDIKGNNILNDLIKLSKQRGIKVRYIVIGITSLYNSFYKSEDGLLEVTGPYDNKKISELLSQYRIGMVLIPSICPETYSYTTSESIYSGYPTISFDIGAPAERIKKYNAGFIIEKISAESLMEIIERILKDKSLLLNRRLM